MPAAGAGDDPQRIGQLLKRWRPSRRRCRKISMPPRRNWPQRGLAKISKRTSSPKSSKSSSSRRFRKSRSSLIVRKLLAMAIACGFDGGAGLAFVVEISDKGIRRSSDIFGIVDSKMIVSIPYIVTTAEARRRKRRMIMLLLGSCSF